MVTDVRFERVTALPLIGNPNTMYFVRPNGAYSIALYVTGSDGVARPVGPSAYVALTMSADVSAALNRPALIGGGIAITVNVPADVPTIAAALSGISQWTWPLTSSVTIQVYDGIYTVTAGHTISHPCSASLRIRGNVANRALCKLQTSASGIAMFYVGAGQILNIDGFELSHTNQATWTNSFGLLADEGGYIHAGPAMACDRFFWNLFSRRGGSSIRAEAGGLYTRAGDTNALAYTGGHIEADGCTLTGATDPASTLGSGAVCEGGTLSIQSAVLSGNKRAGLHQIGGYTRAGNTTFNANTNSGILVDGGEVDITTGCVAGGNGGYGAEGSLELVTGQGLPGLSQGGGGANALGLYRPFIENVFDTLPGSRVSSPNVNESYRFDAKGVGGIYGGNGLGNLFSATDTFRSAKALGLPSIAAGSVPTPDAGFVNFFANPADGNKLYAKNSAGTVTAV